MITKLDNATLFRLFSFKRLSEIALVNTKEKGAFFKTKKSGVKWFKKTFSQINDSILIASMPINNN